MTEEQTKNSETPSATEQTKVSETPSATEEKTNVSETPSPPEEENSKEKSLIQETPEPSQQPEGKSQKKTEKKEKEDEEKPQKKEKEDKEKPQKKEKEDERKLDLGKKEVTLKPELPKIKKALKTDGFPGGETIKNVVLWKNFPVSLGVFLSINFFFYEITFAEFSIVTFLSRAALLALLVLFVHVYGSMFVEYYIQEKGTCKNPLSDKSISITGIDSSTVQSQFSSFVEFINNVILWSGKILFFERPLLSFKAAALLTLTSVLGKMFSGTALLYLFFLFTFTWPRLYREKHEEIDKYASQTFSIISRHISEILEKVQKPKNQ